MPRASTTKQFYSFTGGIDTEANSANYPEDSALQVKNIDLTSNGVASRRKTLVGEGGMTESGTPPTINNFRSSFYWKNVNNEIGRTFLIQQVESTLYFFDLIKDNAGSTYISKIILNGAIGSFSFAVINGLLIVAGSPQGPVIIAYDTLTGAFNLSPPNLRIRDFEGMGPFPQVQYRPPGVKEDHRKHWYNLRNQGWTDEYIDIYSTLTEADNPGAGWIPNNTEIRNIGKNEFNQLDDDGVAKIVAFDFGTSPAPRGNQIIGTVNPQRDREVINSDIFPTPTEGTPGLQPATVVASYASRVFYGQSASEVFSGRILYSQIPDLSYDQGVDAKYGCCYSRNDPTADTFNQLLATDGGVVEIQDLGKIKAMGEIQGTLLIFSDQGVWGLSGGQEGFSAFSVQVKKISNIGVEHAQSVVFTGDGAYYYSGNTIYAVTYDKITLALSVADASQSKIETFLRSKVSKYDYSYGVFDKVTNKAIWLFQKKDPTNVSGTQPLAPDVMLLLNLNNGAFTEYDLGRTLKPVGQFNLIGMVAVEQGEVPSAEKITTSSPYTSAIDTDILSIKMVYSIGLTGLTSIRFGNFIGAPGGKDAVGGTGSFEYNAYRESVLHTGPQTLGDVSRGKDILYLTTTFNRTEDKFEEVATDDIVLTNPSSCRGKVLWDWSDGSDNRASPSQELYRLGRVFAAPDAGTYFKYGKGTVVTKTKMRGAGRAFSFRFSGTPDKDFQLVGWSIETSAGGAV